MKKKFTTAAISENKRRISTLQESIAIFMRYLDHAFNASSADSRHLTFQQTQCQKWIYQKLYLIHFGM